MNGLKTTGAREALMVMMLGLLPACSADDADASGDAGANNGGGGSASNGGGDSSGGGGDSSGGGGGDSNGGGGGNPAQGGGPAFVYDDVVEGCVKLVGCGLPDSTRPNPLRVGVAGLQNSLDLCLTGVLDMLADDGPASNDTRAYGKVIDCARDHADCEGFLACLLYPNTDDECEAQGPRCDGDVLVDCIQVGGANTRVTECAQLGMTCVTLGPKPACGTGEACAVSDPVTCDADGAALACQNGVQTRLLCPPGTKCSPGSGVPCTPTGEPCAQVGMRRCTPEGNVATSYPAGADPTQGRERVVDCVSQHAVCDPEDFRCVPVATYCVAGENDTCLDDGSGFTGYANGEVITVPCARLGRTTCTCNGGQAGCGWSGSARGLHHRGP